MGRVVGAVRVRRTERSFTSVVQPLGAPLELTPLTSLPRAVADTALDYRSPGPMRALVGAAVQRRRCSMAELIAEYEAGPRQHSKVLRIALADLRDGARSAAEATAVRRLARSAVPSFEVNVAVVDRNGRLMRVVDVLWRDLRAALEIDSRMFHFSEADWQATLARHNELTRYGLAVTHYPPNRVTAHGSTFVPEVCEWLTCRAAELGRPLSRRRGTRGGGLDPRPFTVPVFA